MALMGGGSSSGTIIGFDTKNTCLRVMTASQSLTQQMSVNTIPFDERLLSNGDFVSILDNAFAGYSELATMQQSAVTLVLPDNLVAFDYITIPVMKKKAMDDAIKTEFTNMYKNSANLQYNSSIVVQNKRNALVLLSIVDRTLVNAMQRSLTAQKLQPKVTTFGANATLNAVLQMRPKTRRMNFLFVDIRKDSTTFVICGKDRIQGFFSLPFGYGVLSDNEVVPEYLLFEHDVAELAVINATEVAKKKKLTVDADEFEEQEREAEEQAKRDAEEKAKREAEEKAKREAEEKARAEAENAAAENVDSGIVPAEETPEEREARELAELEAQVKAEEEANINEEAAAAKLKLEQEEAAKKAEAASAAEQAALDAQFEEDEEKKATTTATGKVFARKVPRRLPMFMQRPEPETPEAYILENFRIFEKRILLARRQCELEAILPTLDFVLINMPSQYSYIIDKLNEDEDNAGVDFRYYESDSDGNDLVAENLDLYGALFANNYNKNNNF